MEIANAARERKICETPALDFQVCLRMPSPPAKRCVHDQEADVPGLLEVRGGIRVFMGVDALRTVECRR